jgi:hypothetical protein
MMTTLSEFCDEPKCFVTITYVCTRYAPKHAVVVKVQTSGRADVMPLVGAKARALAFSLLAANGNVRIRIRRLPHIQGAPGVGRGVLSRALC